MFPFRATHGAKQNSIGLLTTRKGSLGQWAAMTVDGDATDVVFGFGDADIKALTHCVQHFTRLGHYFWADSVSG